MAHIQSINPFNNELLREFQEFDETQLDACLAKSRKAFESWSSVPMKERAVLMTRCADVLNKNKQELSRLITVEMGKPIVQSISEIEKCAAACIFYAENAEKFLMDEVIPTDASRSFISYQPLGCILAIMPWNFPFWQVFRFAAPALMAGNTGILKHASNVPQCALAIERVFKEAGFPDGAFQSVLIGSSKVKYMIEHPVVKAVTLTGSEKAGEEVAMIAGKNLKKTLLELGGSDCFIVLKDADLEQAAEMAVNARMINNGQSCIAAKRFIVEQGIFDAFTDLMKKNMEKLKIGDPLDEKTTLGPLAREDLAAQLNEFVEATIQKGGKRVYGGSRPETGGAFYAPTILSDLTPSMPAYYEELFGPVASLFKAKDAEEAVRIANDSKYGLGGSIWTKDIEKATELARKIESGQVFINGIVKSDPRLPFGGVKKSGYGRELSYHGIREFVNIKTIWIK